MPNGTYERKKNCDTLPLSTLCNCSLINGFKSRPHSGSRSHDPPARSSYLLFLPHYILAIRIVLRPVVHNVFNISLAIYFAINATGGPFLLFFYYKALHNFLWQTLEKTDKSDCSRLMELRHMEGEGFKIISSNIMFR